MLCAVTCICDILSTECAVHEGGTKGIVAFSPRRIEGGIRPPPPQPSCSWVSLTPISRTSIMPMSRQLTALLLLLAVVLLVKFFVTYSHADDARMAVAAAYAGELSERDVSPLLATDTLSHTLPPDLPPPPPRSPPPPSPSPTYMAGTLSLNSASLSTSDDKVTDVPKAMPPAHTRGRAVAPSLAAPVAARAHHTPRRASRHSTVSSATPHASWEPAAAASRRGGERRYCPNCLAWQDGGGHGGGGGGGTGTGRGGSNGKKPDASYYTKYLHNVIGAKTPYPILKGFLDGVLARYQDKQRWLDAGAGNCGTMQAVAKAGFDVVGVELSDIKTTPCAPLAAQGRVTQGPLHEIPHEGRTFDLVFTSEVLEHVPPNLAEASVRELVRVARGPVFATISLRPSALDRPGKPPKVHLTVRPREWWEALFVKAGCTRDEEAFKQFQQHDAKGAEISPRFFPFLCHLND